MREPVTSPESERGGLSYVRLRLDVAYDGTDFAGWATQPALRTVQGTLEEALARVLRLAEPVRLTCAGRTDAGVHARGQVCHLDVPAEAFEAARGRSDRRPEEVLRDRLRAVLPADVAVCAVSVAPAGFDARFSALWRRYAYRVCDDPGTLDPLRRHEVLFHRRSLDLTAMNEAAGGLVGEHDFAAFCRQRPGATTIRTLRELSWSRVDGLAVARVVADAFCHSMVRALVGAMLAVGDGRRAATWPHEVLEAGVRDPAVTVVAPGGLTLEEVGYPPADQLAARAAEARQVRVRVDGAS